ncbi:MAG: DUF1289 domain-containing protein [Gammaproteobacteria bacterium]
MSGHPPSISSPCIGVCRVSPEHGFCEGCLRTLHEIARWSTLSEHERGQIMRQLNERHQRLDSEICNWR